MKVCKKSFKTKYNAYWEDEFTTLKSAGCENPFDKTAVVLVKILSNLAMVFVYIFLTITAIIWLPIYSLYCWVVERGYM